MSLFSIYYDSPVGKLKLVASDAGLVAVLWQNDKPGQVPLAHLVENEDHPILKQAAQELTEYFASRRRTFKVPLDLRGTDFQKSVWAILQTIPFGQTTTYGEIARQLGSPSASRAVGAANGHNPVSIIMPCHRVVGSTGKLTGFAGGLAAKAQLLQFESAGLKLL